MLHQQNYAAGSSLRGFRRQNGPSFFNSKISFSSLDNSHGHSSHGSNLNDNFHASTKKTLDGKCPETRKTPLSSKAPVPEMKSLPAYHVNALYHVGSSYETDYPRGNLSPKSSKKTFVLRKYEMCTNDKCQYGSKCKFAHSEEELVRVYSELSQEGRVDNMETDRNLPCFDYLSTGTCPYKDRCNRIHDPRWAPRSTLYDEAWLKHREMPCQDYPVNKTYHLIQDEMFSGGRLFRQNGLETNLCNMEGNTGISDVLSLVKIETLGKIHEAPFRFDCAGSHERHAISEIAALSIDIAMHDSKTFTFQPSHVLGGQPCMVMKSTTWFIQGQDQLRHVHKIAFGPAGKTSGGKLPPVALWFDLTPKELVENAEKAKEQHKEHHKNWAGERLTEDAQMILRDRLGIVQHYNYDRHVSSLCLDRVILRLAKLVCEKEESKHKAYIPSICLDEAVYELQSRVIEARLKGSLSRYFEICTSLTCEDRVNENALRPSCDRFCSPRGKTHRAKQHLTHFHNSFQDGLNQSIVAHVQDPPRTLRLYQRRSRNAKPYSNCTCVPLSMPPYDIHNEETTLDSKWNKWRSSFNHQQYEGFYERAELAKKMKSHRF